MKITESSCFWGISILNYILTSVLLSEDQLAEDQLAEDQLAEDQLAEQVKQEAVEIPDDDDVDSTATEEYTEVREAGVIEHDLEQPQEIEDEPPKETEEEMIFSVAGNVKSFNCLVCWPR